MFTRQDSNWVNVPGWRSGPELRDPGTAIHLLWFQGGRKLIPSIIIYIIIKGQYSWGRRNTKYNFNQLNQGDRKLIIPVYTKYNFHKPDQGLGSSFRQYKIQINWPDQRDRIAKFILNIKYKFNKPDQGDRKLIPSIQNTISTIQTRGIGSSSRLYKI